MAQQLGFVVVEMNRQYAGDVNEDDLMEVRNELYFGDLIRGSEASIRVQDRLRKSLPPRCEQIAGVWRNTCVASGLADVFDQLRYTKKVYERATLVDWLRRAAKSQLGVRGGW